MPVNPDVMQIVRILDEEGFGALAGELLTEISLGRELDISDEYLSKAMDAETGDLFSTDAEPTREQIPDSEQLREAVRILRLRLVEPARYLAEAEQIAEDLAREQDASSVPTRGLLEGKRILFVSPDGESSVSFVRSEGPGDTRSAEELDQVLARIADLP